jgi:GT2 family glycosyltransferase
LLEVEAVVATPTVVVARQLLERVGGFDESLLLHEEYDLWLRLNMHSEVDVIEMPLACVRSHREHYSGGSIRSHEGRRHLLEKMRGVVVEPRMRSMVLTAQSRNAVRLARAYASAGDGRAVVRVLLRSWRYSWWRARWWMRAGLAVLRLFIPGWVIAFRRHARSSSDNS